MTTHNMQRTFRLTEDLWARLEHIRTRDGVPISEQIRRGLLLYFAQKGLADVAEPVVTAVTQKRAKKVSRG